MPNNTPSHRQRVGRVSEFTDETRFDFTRVILDDDIHGGDKVLLVIIFGNERAYAPRDTMKLFQTIICYSE